MTQQIRGRRDWTLLAENDSVAVTEASGRRFSAVVDAKTADSSVVWVIDASGYRRAFDHREDVELTALPEDAPTV